ncbi:nitrite reductase/ring-hydroxylating ferredoxin subunit [Flavobacterium sp. PL11]|jgi:nitrite reductase/ring-hydroxylating ferredoxin subunit|uniref:Rieske (2Fe-2S) protein n=1 Tax=Flavobacterium sp. PL11 TaxID=3071717 RepID=UPI002E02E6F4|nr:nitrite reductase/ring-hydroxylating ferredoxin subunit [Flavobacterium sp. PL11]
MKKYSFFLLSIILLTSCTEQGIRNNNPYLPNYAVLIDLNLKLPEYSSLKFVSNAVLIPGKGVRGVVVFNTGSGYNAFDAACPNQTLSSCSTMTIKGINLLCPCDNEEYSLFSGQSKLQYPLKQYRVQVNGDVLRVYN